MNASHNIRNHRYRRVIDTQSLPLFRIILLKKRLIKLNPDLKLNSTPPSVTSSYSLNGLQEWVAKPTQSAVTINPGDWILFLDYYIPCADCMGRLWIEVWNDSAKIADGNMFFGTGGHGTMDIYLRDGIRADFKEGECLRLKMKWEPAVGYSGSIKLYSRASGSKLSGPPVNTNAPVPESSAFVPFAGGLSILSGYLFTFFNLIC